LAWSAPDTNNILQVWVRTIGQNDDKMVTADKKRGVDYFSLAANGRTILSNQDSDGEEHLHVFGIDLESGNVRDLTPFQGVRANLLGTHRDFPDEVLVTMNLRDRSVLDVHRVNLRTGAITLDT
jgi:hypothetical protein